MTLEYFVFNSNTQSCINQLDISIRLVFRLVRHIYSFIACASKVGGGVKIAYSDDIVSNSCVLILVAHPSPNRSISRIIKPETSTRITRCAERLLAPLAVRPLPLRSTLSTHPPLRYMSLSDVVSCTDYLQRQSNLVGLRPTHLHGLRIHPPGRLVRLCAQSLR